VQFLAGPNNNPGNVAFRHLVNEAKFDYLYTYHGNETVKREIESMIIKAVHESGGRFIKLDKTTGCWTELSEEEATAKVRAALREIVAEDPPSDWKPSEEDYHEWQDAEFGMADSVNEPVPDDLNTVVGLLDQDNDMIVGRGRTSQGPKMMLPQQYCT
jgi:hypothetical protein